MKKTKDEERFIMWKKVLSKNKSSRLPREDIFVTYLEQLNKVTYDFEIDTVLDAIIENERTRRK